MTQLPVFCGKDCGGDACPLLACVENGQVQRVINNPAGGKYLKGCQRGFNLPLETYAPDRIMHPLVRNGPRGSGQYRQATWEEALHITAENLGEIRAKYGANSVLNRSSAGSIGALHSTSSLLRRFLTFYGGYTRLTGSYSDGAAIFALPYLFGKEWVSTGFDASTMQASEMIILWGANVLETRQGAEVPQRLLQAKKRGAQIVVVDPRRSATVKRAATWWIPCRPGTDTALILAVLFVLLSEELVDRAFITAHSSGFDQLTDFVLGKSNPPGGEGEKVAHSPGWAEAICGVPAAEITRFAHAYAAAKPALLFPGYSIQRVYAGEEPIRLTVALQLATGNFGQKGGSTGSLNNLLAPPKAGRLSVPSLYTSPEVPKLRWPDAILEGRSGGYPTDIHAVYNLGSNLVNQGGDIHKSIAASQKVDFAVSHEMFMTPTARWCDVIFPVATALEKEDLGIPWAGNYLLYKSQVISPRGQARHDYDILSDLAGRLGFGTEFSENRSASEWIAQFIQESEISDPQAFKQTGIYWGSNQSRTGLAEFTADPHRCPLCTPSGKVEIASEAYQKDTGFPAIPTWQPAPRAERFPLQLITPKSVHRTHSQGSNIESIRKKAKHALEMHPLDAEPRGIKDGDKAYVFNETGSTLVPVRLSEGLTPGVVCLPEGVWLELDEQGIDQAGSVNMLTSTEGTKPAVACIMHGVGVEVKKVGG